MSLIGRRSGGPSFDAGNAVQRNSVERVSLSAAPMDGETRFSERGGASGSLNDSLLGPDGEPVFDPTARESALEIRRRRLAPDARRGGPAVLRHEGEY